MMHAIQSAKHSPSLEGFIVTAAAEADARRVLQGKMSMNEPVNNVKSESNV